MSPASGRTPGFSQAGRGEEALRPRLLVSRCLGFAACRYDGSVIVAPEVEALQENVEFIPTCPEVEIGLPVPRPPVRLVRVGESVRLVQPDTDRDLTDAMETFAHRFLEALPAVDGIILKSRSPSCGIGDAKVYAGKAKGPPVGKQAGAFAAAVRRSHPSLPLEDEGRLTNLAVRDHFLTGAFALARLRKVEEQGRMSDLVRFHAEHKLLLMAVSQAKLRELGRVVANADRRPVREALSAYRSLFQSALSSPFRRPSVANTLQHALGYFSDGLSPGEKAFFLDLLSQYRAGRIGLGEPLTVLRAWILRFDEPYLAGQKLFFPYPASLLSPRDSGRGEDR